MHIKNSTFLIVSVLLALGLAFRLYDSGSYIFGFDQIQILTNAERIKSGDLTLLGPRTGPAEMFTGPLIYYLTAVLLLAIPNPWALVATSASIAGITGLGLFWLGKRHVSQAVGVALLGAWAFSPLLIFFDRVVWNPNLTLIASSLVFFPLLSTLRGKKLMLPDYASLFLGVFLGFQAHFSGLLLLPLLVVFQLLWRRVALKSLIAGFFGLIITLLPTLIFDLRNNWLNVRGLLSFLSNRDEVHDSFQIFRFSSGLETNLKNLGGVVSFRYDESISLFIGIVLLSAALYLWWKQRPHKNDPRLVYISASLLWSLLVTIALSFYSSQAPEYYFFISLPALLLLIALHLPSQVSMQTQATAVAVCSIFGGLYILMDIERITSVSTYTIGTQLAVARDLAQKSITEPIQKLVYDMRPVDALGVEYFVSRLVPLHETGSLAHIVTTTEYSSKYRNLGVWFDPRGDASRNYLTQNDLIISTPKGTELLQNYYQGPRFGSNRVFSLVQESTVMAGELVVIDLISDALSPDNQTIKDFLESTTPLKDSPYWATAVYNEVEGFVQRHERFALFYVPEQLDRTSIPAELSLFSVYSIKPRVL